MKNSLLLLQQSIENLGSKLPKDNSDAAEQLASAHYEAARLNTGLVQLLSLYRAEMENLPINVDECYVEDLIDEVLANNQNYVTHKNKTLEVQHNADVAWFMDADLINLLLNDVLVNAMRYSRTTIRLSTFVDNGWLCFRVEDDGPGYPKSMLKANAVKMQDFDISHGRTGLGLFFARLIAQAHTRGQQHGSIELANAGALGGSVFTLRLP